MDDRTPHIPDSNHEQQQSPLAEVTSQSGPSYMDDLKYHKLANFFELSYDERRDPDVAGKLSFLREWGGEMSSSKDHVAILQELKKSIRGLGITHKGQDLIKRLYMYARLDSQRSRLDREMRLYSDKPQKAVKRAVRASKPQSKPLDTKNLQSQVKQKLSKIESQVKSTVQSTINNSIKRGIQDAISNIRI